MKTGLRLLLLVSLLLGGAGPGQAIEDFKTVTLQNAAGATGDGTAIEVASYTSVALAVTISATATVTFEGTADGSTWASRSCVSIASTSGTGVTSATATGTYQCNVAGLSQFRARISSFGSGTVTVLARATTAVARVGGGGLPDVGNEADCLLTTSGAWTAGACPGAAGGDSISVDGSAVVDPNFASTGDVDFVNTANTITANINANSVALGTDTTGNYAAGDAEGGAATSGDSATSFFSSGTIEDARLPSSMADKVFTGSILLPNGTAVPGTCSIGMIYFDNNATAGVNLYGCTASNTWTLLGDGSGSGAIATDTIWDAAGDLVYGSGSNTAVRLAPGTANQLLQMNSGATAPEWTSTPSVTSLTVAGGGAGKITLTEGTCTAGGSASQHGVCIDSTTNRLASYENAGSQVNYVASGDNIGAATATTPSANDNDTSVATTAYVQTELTAYASDTVTFTNKTLTSPIISSISNTGTVTLFTASDTVVGKATTDTLTNKTIDTAGTGNSFTIPVRTYLPAAGCNNATAGSVWNLPTANAPAAACITGTNTQKGVLDFDATTDESAQVEILLPATWVGAIDANVLWHSGTTTGSVAWCIQLISSADAETDDPAYPAQATGNCVSDAAKGTANQLNVAALTGITATGVAAGELLHIQISRDPNETSTRTDDHAADARLVGVELIYRVTE